MRRMPTSRLLRGSLFLNGALLGLAAGYLLFGRAGGPAAFALAQDGAMPPAIAGGAGLFLMPGQINKDTWGVYLMDVDAQNLCVYSYKGSERTLSLMAARGFRDDLRLADYNTAPSPREIKQLADETRAAQEQSGGG